AAHGLNPARVATDRVVAGTASDRRPARPAAKHVVAAISVELVVAAAAPDTVPAASTANRVGPAVSPQGVIGAIADDRVAARSASHVLNDRTQGDRNVAHQAGHV